MTARSLGGCDDRILPLAFECILAPHFIGFGFNLLHLVRLAELLEEFGWQVTEQLVCNLVAKMLGRHRGTPDGVRREAIEAYTALQAELDHIAEPDGSFDFDDDAFRRSPALGRARHRVRRRHGGSAIGRPRQPNRRHHGHARGRPHGAHAGQLQSGVVGSRCGDADGIRHPGHPPPSGYALAAKAVYHAAWQFYSDRWLNIPNRPLSRAKLNPSAATTDDVGAERAAIVDAIESIRVNDVGPLVRKHLAAGHPTGELLDEIALALLKHDTGWDILDTLRVVYDEAQTCREHPAVHQLVVGLARFTTGARRSNNSDSATRTASASPGVRRRWTCTSLRDAV